MTNPNQSSPSPEQEPFAHQERVQYNDGEVTLGFRTPGDRLELGRGSTHSRAREFDLSDMALIRTKSGNEYALGQGLVLNCNAGRYYQLPEELPDITIGKSWEVPGVGVTTAVESVQLRWKIAPPGYGNVQVDEPCPFERIKDVLSATREAIGQQGTQ